MADIHIQPVTSPGESHIDWLLFEHGAYSRPIAILGDHEMHRLVRAYAKHSPVAAQGAVEAGKRDASSEVTT